MSVKMVANGTPGNACRRLFTQRPVEVGNQRDHHVGPVMRPIPVQNVDLLAVRESDYKVHERNQLGGTERPPAPQHDVVYLLKLNAGILPDEVDGVQQILNGHHLDVP